VHFGFGQRHTDTQHAAMSAGPNADRDEHRTVPDASGDSDFLIASIDDQVFDLVERPISPCLKLFIEHPFQQVPGRLD